MTAAFSTAHTSLRSYSKQNTVCLPLTHIEPDILMWRRRTAENRSKITKSDKRDRRIIFLSAAFAVDMDFFGRKNYSEGKTPLENSKKISERVSEIGLVSRQIEYNAQKNLADIGRLLVAQGNQSPWEQKKTNHDDIKSWMCYQDNLSAENKKRIKHNDIKRWVFSQNKHLKLGSNEMPSEETMLDGPQNYYEVLRELDEAERTLIAQEKLLLGLLPLRQETSSFDAYFNMTSSKDCDINMGDLKLSGDDPKEAAKNQHKGGWHRVLDAPKMDGESPNIGKSVQYVSPLPRPSQFVRPKGSPLLAGCKKPIILPAGYDLSSMRKIKDPNHWSLRPNVRTGDHIY